MNEEITVISVSIQKRGLSILVENLVLICDILMYYYDMCLLYKEDIFN